MRIYYPPYDFIIIGGATLIIGYIFGKVFLKTKAKKLTRKLVPYSIAFLIVSLLFAFSIDELPLKFYVDNDTVIDNKNTPHGPNIGKGLIAGLIYIVSVIFNFILWGLSLAIIIASVLKSNKLNNIQSQSDK